nr:uncharacterized protein LOC108175338 [Malus domestica]
MAVRGGYGPVPIFKKEKRGGPGRAFVIFGSGRFLEYRNRGLSVSPSIVPFPRLLRSSSPSPTVNSPRRRQRHHHPSSFSPSPLQSILSSSTAIPAVVTAITPSPSSRTLVPAIIPLKFRIQCLPAQISTIAVSSLGNDSFSCTFSSQRYRQLSGAVVAIMHLFLRV